MFVNSDVDWEFKINLAVGRIMCFLWPLAIALECNLIEAYLLGRLCLGKAYKHINLASVSACQSQVSAKMKDSIFSWFGCLQIFKLGEQTWGQGVSGWASGRKMTCFHGQTVILFFSLISIFQNESLVFYPTAVVEFHIKNRNKNLLLLCICQFFLRNR